MKKLLLIMWLLLPFSASAEEPLNEPKAVVQDIFAKAGVPEAATDSAKQNEISDHVDFDTLARSALGREFKKASPGDYKWFRDTLKEIITRTVYPKAPEFLQGVKIVYNNVDTSGTKSKVKSTVQNKADLTDVDYKLEKTKAGAWKVVDVSIAGQSWVESIQEQVSQVIKKKKWKGLREAMNRRLKEIKAGKG